MWLLSMHVARAQTAPSVSTSAKDAWPGIWRVGVPITQTPGLSVATYGGYGWTHDVLLRDDTHHRVMGALSAALALSSEFSLNAQLEGRGDLHRGDGISDESYVGHPKFGARYSHDISNELGVGLQSVIWVPGTEAPSFVFNATTVDFVALGRYTVSSFTLAMNAGFRFDNSANAAVNPDQFSLADRMSLGLSDSHAALLGVGASYRMDAWQILGEWTWDALVGSAAPPLRASPMRVAAGARWSAQRAWSAQFMIEASPSARFTPAQGQPLVPIEPTVSALLGAVYVFSETPQNKDSAAEASNLAARSAAKNTCSVKGAVLDADKTPVARANVSVDNAATAQANENGVFVLSDLVPGAHTVTAQAKGYAEASQQVRCSAGQTLQLEWVLPRMPAGQIRGFVRSFSGEYLTATIRIDLLALKLQTETDGSFEVDVQPGDYDVTIEAEGYRPQTRSVRVDDKGVTVLNVDLQSQE